MPSANLGESLSWQHFRLARIENAAAIAETIRWKAFITVLTREQSNGRQHDPNRSAGGGVAVGPPAP